MLLVTYSSLVCTQTARLINLSCKLEVAFFYACLKGDATAVGSMLDGEDGVDVDAVS